jgi:hypothetical protein
MNGMNKAMGFGTIAMAITGVLMYVVMFMRYEYVPKNTLGKILTTSGYATDIIKPSRVHLNRRDKLILLEDVITTKEEKVTVRMDGNLDLVVMVRFQFMLSKKNKDINMLFSSAKSTKGVIRMNTIYATYGKIPVNKCIREVVSTYKILDVNKNFKRISKELYSAIYKEFEGSPLVISDISLGKMIFPEEIDSALRATVKRKLEVKKTEADVEAKLVEYKGKKRIAEAEYIIAMQKAKRTRDYNEMISKGVTPQLLELQRIEVQEKMVEAIKGNSNAVYIPMNMFGSTIPTMPIK